METAKKGFDIAKFELPEMKIVVKENAGNALFGDKPIDNSEDAAKLIAEKLLRDADREYMIVVCLNTKMKPIAYHIVSIGTINATVVEPREILKPAILSNASSIIMMHNHPSGDTRPSKEDVKITHRMTKACGDIMGIPLLDHIIVGGGENPQRYYSFRMEGNLE